MLDALECPEHSKKATTKVSLSQFFYFCGIINRRTMIDQIIAFNKTFVAQKGYETHPLVPKDIVVRGFIIDSETGALEEID